MLPPRDTPQNKRYRLKVIIISNNRDFKTKAIVRDKKGHHIMIKGAIQKENITLVHIYILHIRAPKYVNQILMDIKGEINRNTVIVEDFNTPWTSMDRSSR